MQIGIAKNTNEKVLIAWQWGLLVFYFVVSWSAREGYVNAQPDHGIKLLLLIETTSDLELIREPTSTLIVLQIFEPSHYRNCTLVQRTYSSAD